METHVVILAAGRGKRMASNKAKVLAPLGGWPLLRHVVETAQAVQPTRIHVVYGHGGDEVRSALEYLDVNWVHQTEQLGTGHAVAEAMVGVPDGARVLVLYGDVPLVRADTLSRLLEAGAEHLALLSVVVNEPAGYGRVIRDDANNVVAVVEDKDLVRNQRSIREINTGLVCAPAASLRGWLGRLNNDNAQAEYYLTDCIAMAVADGQPVVAGQADEAGETQGINDRRDLARAERLLQQRQANTLLARGVTLRDPQRFDLRGTLSVGRDVLIDVNVVVEGNVELGDDVQIGPNCVLRSSRIDSGTQIMANSVVEHAEIGAGCRIGPFARLRPETRLADRARVGNFVETKKISLGHDSKINHLSYVGDARVGDNVNIGAGTITCNYDGANKHLTAIGDNAFIGSNTQLVAPVSIGAGATIGAGSTITRDASADTLTLSRSRQVTVDGWQRPKKQTPGHE